MRTPLILLHGALGAKSQFDNWIPWLEKDFDIHVMDFEGHGSKGFEERAFRIEYFAENLESYIQKHDLAPANIFGYSMGGYVALYLAEAKPDLIGRIFTFATKLAWNSESSAKEVRMLDPETILEKVPKFAKMLEARHHGNEWKEHLAKTAEMMLHLGEHPLLTKTQFAGIHQPVRIGRGDRDKMVSLEETNYAFRELPNAEFTVLPGTPHPIEKIKPERIIPQIQEFFGQ